MTWENFNKKYSAYLEPNHYGARGFNNPEFLDWLDTKFQEFIQAPGFTFSQIKTKFGIGRFYCKGLSTGQVREVENKITEFCKKSNS